MNTLTNSIMKISGVFFYVILLLYIIMTFMPVETVSKYGYNIFEQSAGYWMTRSAEKNNDAVLFEAIEATKYCMNDECRMYEIFMYLDKNLHYSEVGSIMLPAIEVLDDGYGDCKTMAYTYCAMLNQLNIDCNVYAYKCHAFARVKFSDTNVAVDLTRGYFGSFQKQLEYTIHMCEEYE